MKLLRTLLVASAALAMAAPLLAASVTEVSFKGEKALQMENGLLRAVVVPALSGRIAVFQDKTGANLMKEYEFKSRMPFWKTGNLAGWNDMILQEGVRYNEYTYKCTAKGADDNGAFVEVTLDTEGRTLVRRMTLPEGSRVLKVETTVTSLKSAAIDWNYWVNTLLPRAGKVEDTTYKAFVPAAPGKAADSGSSNNSALEMLIEAGYGLQDKTNISKDTLLEGAPENSVSFNVKLAQPWWAIIDTKTQDGLAELLTPSEMDGMISYFCFNGEDTSTMEIIFAKKSFKPEESATYHLDIAALRGLERADWMSGDMAVAASGKRLQAVSKSGSIAFKVLQLKADKGAKLSVRLKSVSDGKILGPWQVALSGDCKAPQNISVRLSGNIAPGVYEILLGEGEKPLPMLGRLVKIAD
jgi:hypothetical protein